MSNLRDPVEATGDGLRAVRVAERAGAEFLGASVYELQPGDEMVFHYHVQREELLIVLEGRLKLRTADGWEELPEGEVVAFPRGERGAHGFRNDGASPVRVLMVSEMNGPNISVYPDANQVGVFDAGARARRRFGALFNVSDAVADYGGKAELVAPAPGPRRPPATRSRRPPGGQLVNRDLEPDDREPEGAVDDAGDDGGHEAALRPPAGGEAPRGEL
jgi:uncharacterized cupin superfamily protein